MYFFENIKNALMKLGGCLVSLLFLGVSVTLMYLSWAFGLAVLAITLRAFFWVVDHVSGAGFIALILAIILAFMIWAATHKNQD